MNGQFLWFFWLSEIGWSISNLDDQFWLILNGQFLWFFEFIWLGKIGWSISKYWLIIEWSIWWFFLKFYWFSEFGWSISNLGWFLNGQFWLNSLRRNLMSNCGWFQKDEISNNLAINSIILNSIKTVNKISLVEIGWWILDWINHKVQNSKCIRSRDQAAMTSSFLDPKNGIKGKMKNPPVKNFQIMQISSGSWKRIPRESRICKWGGAKLLRRKTLASAFRAQSGSFNRQSIKIHQNQSKSVKISQNQSELFKYEIWTLLRTSTATVQFSHFYPMTFV